MYFGQKRWISNGSNIALFKYYSKILNRRLNDKAKAENAIEMIVSALNPKNGLCPPHPHRTRNIFFFNLKHRNCISNLI